MNKPTSVTPTIYTFTVTQDDAALRLDSFIAKKIPNHSRSYLQKLFASNLISVNSKVAPKPSMEIKPGDVITVELPPLPPLGVPKPFEGDLGVRMVYEHPDFLIVSKPAGLTTHAPSMSSQEVTLVDWLLAKFADLAKVGAEDRPGIVHRLDKDTSGLMIIPRNNTAHMIFGDMFKQRKIQKTYLALVKGHPAPSGIIDLPITRHPHLKHKMTHIDEKKNSWAAEGRQAVTHYKVLEQLKDCALVEAKPVTGRTHQIRVHFTALGHPLIGDAVYGTKSPLMNRQALHAHALSFEFNGTPYNFVEQVPEDFAKALEQARKV